MISALLTSLDSLGTNEIVFPKLGIDLYVKSVAFTVFGASITWYGILITVGMMLAMIYVFKRMRSFGIDPDRAIDGIIGGVIGGIIGARAYYIAFHWSEYAGDWKAIFNIRSGGLGIYGGLIGALIVGSVVCKLRKVRLRPMYDIVSLGFLIGQCVGRWGNFTNHEAFGKNTEWITGMSSGKIQAWIAKNYADGSVVPDQPVHPCFLYESLWCLLGFVLLHFVSKKRKFDGQIFLMYVIWYGTGRFFIEWLRTDSLYLGTVKVSQLVAVVSVTVSVVLLLVGLSYAKRMGSDCPLYVDTEESKALLEEADRRELEALEKRSKKAKHEEETEQTESILAPDEPETPSAEDAEEAAARRKAEQAKRDAENEALIAEIAAEAAKAEQAAAEAEQTDAADKPENPENKN